jgi:hypothetical protein
MYTMADLVTDLAAKSGLSPDLARKGLGIVLEFFKSKLPADTFSKITAAVPGTEGLIASAQTDAESSGGVLSAVTSAIGKLFGGGAAAEMASKMTHLGFSAEQLQSFLPKVLEFFRSKLPADLMSQVSGLLPAPKEPVG